MTMGELMASRADPAFVIHWEGQVSGIVHCEGDSFLMSGESCPDKVRVSLATLKQLWVGFSHCESVLWELVSGT